MVGPIMVHQRKLMFEHTTQRETALLLIILNALEKAMKLLKKIFGQKAQPDPAISYGCCPCSIWMWARGRIYEYDPPEPFSIRRKP